MRYHTSFSDNKLGLDSAHPEPEPKGLPSPAVHCTASWNNQLSSSLPDCLTVEQVILK